MDANTKTETQTKQRKFYNKWLFSLGLVILSCAYIFLISDSNIRRHRQLNQQAKTLKKEIAKVEHLTENAYTFEEISKNPKRLEQYVREKMKMQRPGEDVFVIEYK